MAVVLFVTCGPFESDSNTLLDFMWFLKMILQTICIFVNVLWSDAFHCLDVLPACKRWNLRTLSFAGSATVPSFTSLENNISINQHTTNHSNVFVFKPNAIIDWHAINNSDFAKSTNMLKIDNILSSHLSLAGSLRRFVASLRRTSKSGRCRWAMPWPKPAGSGAQLVKELRNRQVGKQNR